MRSKPPDRTLMRSERQRLLIVASIFSRCLRALSRRAATRYSNARKGSGSRGTRPRGWKGVGFSNLRRAPGGSNEVSNVSTPAEDKSRDRPSTMRSAPPVPVNDGINNRMRIVSYARSHPQRLAASVIVPRRQPERLHVRITTADDVDHFQARPSIEISRPAISSISIFSSFHNSMLENVFFLISIET